MVPGRRCRRVQAEHRDVSPGLAGPASADKRGGPRGGAPGRPPPHRRQVQPGQLPRLERRSMTRCTDAWNADWLSVPSRYPLSRPSMACFALGEVA